MSGTEQNRTIAITGATGLIGRYLCDHFRARGWNVNAMVRDVSQYPFRNEGIRTYKCVLPESIETEALETANVLIHAAYMTRFTSIEEAQRVNEEGTVKLYEASRSFGVKQFVFVSSRAARPKAGSFYGQSKFRLENMMDMERDLVIRLGLVLANDGGLFYRMAMQIKHFPVIPVFGGGRQKLNTVHIDDLCSVFEWAVENQKCGLMTVAEPEGITMKELIYAISEQMGLHKMIVSLPGKPSVWLLQVFEYLGIKLPVSSENLRGLLSIDNTQSSISHDVKMSGIRIRPAHESIKNLVSKF